METKSTAKVDRASAVREDAQTQQTRATVTAFYTAFQKHDGDAMYNLYAHPKGAAADAPVFSDEVFRGLDAKQAGDMWRMLCGAQDLSIKFSVKEVQGNKATVEWIANYAFPPTGKPVENHVTAQIEVKDGKIVKHTDSFDLPKWLSQAFAMPELASSDPTPHFPCHMVDVEAGLLAMGVRAGARFGLWNFERTHADAPAAQFDRSPKPK